MGISVASVYDNQQKAYDFSRMNAIRLVVMHLQVYNKVGTKWTTSNKAVYNIGYHLI